MSLQDTRKEQFQEGAKLLAKAGYTGRQIETASDVINFLHRTEQQSLGRAIFAIIRHWGTTEYYDGRNEATVMACRKIVAMMDKEEPGWDGLPLI